jgi:hypothetical protein
MFKESYDKLLAIKNPFCQLFGQLSYLLKTPTATEYEHARILPNQNLSKTK